MYRSKEYKNADIPVLPVVKGTRLTQLYILFYIASFTMAACLLTLFGYTGLVFVLAAGGLGIYWLLQGVKGFSAANTDKWARGMFGISLLVISVLSAVLVASAWLP
jgi:protoheme IX farnesyltransferase